ncbi:1-acyl-sn-glycerol-3-phosphate acyltransferase [Phormidium tenue FACHB-886]|nr:1-acyl-sn-glycerol-3-phosphate acyltransferase [Phormidium tenue FACHB-886]
MPQPITQAQPPLEFIPPAYDPVIHQTARAVLPLWTRWRVKIADIQVQNAEVLAEFYQQFQAGNRRFLLAFRHPSTTDPFCLFYLMNQALPKVARQKGIALQQPTHAHFMYDRGIPLWAGKPAGWLLQHLGCTPIRRGKLDLLGLRSAREIFANGRFPIAAAPEGATNGHNEIVSPIEPGIAQLGFWCIEDLLKANRLETVWILPVGVQYRYVSPPWQEIEQVLGELEADCGLSRYETPSEAPLPETPSIAALDPAQLMLYRRLLRLGEHLLTAMEQFYSKFYHQNLRASTIQAAPPDTESPNTQIAHRMQRLLDTALAVSEQYFNVPAKGTLPDRCRRLEQAGWDWIYREDLKTLENLSPVDRGLADRIAEEASLHLWHMRLTESFVSVSGRYILEKPTADRFAETLLLLYDTIYKIKGRAYVQRPRLGLQHAKLTIGEPISVSDRWSTYKTNRRQAVSALTQTIQEGLQQLIE